MKTMNKTWRITSHYSSDIMKFCFLFWSKQLEALNGCYKKRKWYQVGRRRARAIRVTLGTSFSQSAGPPFSGWRCHKIIQFIHSKLIHLQAVQGAGSITKIADCDIAGFRKYASIPSNCKYQMIPGLFNWILFHQIAIQGIGWWTDNPRYAIFQINWFKFNGIIIYYYLSNQFVLLAINPLLTPFCFGMNHTSSSHSLTGQSKRNIDEYHAEWSKKIK